MFQITTEPPSPEQIEQDLTVSFLSANLLALPIVLVTPVAVIALHLGLHPSSSLHSMLAGGNVLLLLTCLLLLVVVHEWLHAAGFFIGGASRHHVAFGFDVKTLTPYAHCAQPLPARAMRLAIALPGIVLGLLPALAGLVSGVGLLSLLGGVGIATASGDVLMLWLLRRVPADRLLADHPKRVGCYVLRPPAGDRPSES